MKKVNIKDIMGLKNDLEKVKLYLSRSKDFFKDLDSILSNVNLSDKDKVVAINNKYKEFESGVI